MWVGDSYVKVSSPWEESRWGGGESGGFGNVSPPPRHETLRFGPRPVETEARGPRPRSLARRGGGSPRTPRLDAPWEPSKDAECEWRAQLCFSPGFILPVPWKGGEPQPGEGAGKKHLITGVSLLVTRRWQRLPWVSRFRERRVFCLKARGLLRSLPRLGGRPGPSEPLSTPASAARPARLTLCGPRRWRGQRGRESSRAKSKGSRGRPAQPGAGSDHEPPPNTHTHTLARHAGASSRGQNKTCGVDSC